MSCIRIVSKSAKQKLIDLNQRKQSTFFHFSLWNQWGLKVLNYDQTMLRDFKKTSGWLQIIWSYWRLQTLEIFSIKSASMWEMLWNHIQAQKFEGEH